MSTGLKRSRINISKRPMTGEETTMDESTLVPNPSQQPIHNFRGRTDEATKIEN